MQSLRLKYKIVLKKDGQTTVDITTTKKGRVLFFVQVEEWESAYLKVGYGPGWSCYNDGEYENIADFKKALRAFTSKQLIEEELR